MDLKEITMYLADIHNRLSDISVCGDGAIRMGDVLRSIRAMVAQLQSEGQQPPEEDGKKE